LCPEISSFSVDVIKFYGTSFSGCVRETETLGCVVSTLLTIMGNHLHYTNDGFYDESKACFKHQALLFCIFSLCRRLMTYIMANTERSTSQANAEENEWKRKTEIKNRIKEHLCFVDVNVTLITLPARHFVDGDIN
jgi:UDP-N-acetylmuramoylalanine-D-glutamate ligase